MLNLWKVRLSRLKHGRNIVVMGSTTQNENGLGQKKSFLFIVGPGNIALVCEVDIELPAHHELFTKTGTFSLQFEPAKGEVRRLMTARWVCDFFAR